MNETSPDLKAQILEKVHRASGQRVWTPRDFLDLGERYAVDKALQRMAINGELRRIARGLYDNPTFNALTQKDNPPNPRQVIEAVARREQIRVLVDGLTAANDLGLTNAVPAKNYIQADCGQQTVLGGAPSDADSPGITLAARHHGTAGRRSATHKPPRSHSKSNKGRTHDQGRSQKRSDSAPHMDAKNVASANYVKR